MAVEQCCPCLPTCKTSAHSLISFVAASHGYRCDRQRANTMYREIKNLENVKFK